MVAFNDRRSVILATPKDAPDLTSGSGVSLSRKVINGVFVVRSVPNIEQGRSYSVHEVLPSDETITREVGHRTRYSARKSALGMSPSSVREL